MKVLSLFSGVGGFDIGFQRAGFDIAAMCEIDTYAQSVLRYHWPDVPLYKDVKDLKGKDFLDVDVVVGGFPCQDLSVAGSRKGFTGERSVLFYEAARVVQEIREATGGKYPRFFVLENVPGLLSSHGGRDFAALLREMAKLGALDISWRMLDSRYFGVAQRRRRVFIVADFGAERAREVLFEPEGVRGDNQKGRTTGEGTPAGAQSSPRILNPWDSQSLRIHGGDVAPSLTGQYENGGERSPRMLLPTEPTVVNAEGMEGLPSLSASNLAKRFNNQQPLVIAFSHKDNGRDATEELSPTLRSYNSVDTNQATGGMAVAYPALAFEAQITTMVETDMGDWSPPLRTKTTPAVVHPTRTMRESGQGYWMEDEKAGTLSAASGSDAIMRPAVIFEPKRAATLKPVGSNDIISDATDKTDAREILRKLRQEVGEEAFEEWGIGVLAAFHQAPVLQPRVYEEGVQEEAKSDRRERESRKVPGEADSAARAMLDAWEARRAGHTPQGREPLEQRPEQLGAYLSLLSYQDSPGQGFLQDLWEASEGLRSLREALSEIQNDGRPVEGIDTATKGLFGAGMPKPSKCSEPLRQTLHAEEENRNAAKPLSEGPEYTVRRLLPVECELLQGWPRDHTRWGTTSSGDVNEISDTQRYRMAGNGCTATVTEWIARRIREVLS